MEVAYDTNCILDILLGCCVINVTQCGMCYICYKCYTYVTDVTCVTGVTKFKNNNNSTFLLFYRLSNVFFLNVTCLLLDLIC